MRGSTDDAVLREGIFRADGPFMQKPFTRYVLARKAREILDR